VAGEYIWTGFDYLGEPTPYMDKWPSRSSYFGAIDLAGLPKNRFYLYKSVWTDENVLHVFPHWTWHGKEGKNVPVHVYTNLPKAELFVNGESQGTRRHESTNEIDRFRMRWDNVIYQPGEIKVVGYDFYDRPVMEKIIKTAGFFMHFLRFYFKV
jgi:beta-galactosidase